MYKLIGLTGSSPIAFMAALGMLRVLSSDRSMKVRLGWKEGHAILEGADKDTIISELTSNMEGRSEAPEFNWTDSPRKISPEAYRLACQGMKGDERALSFMAGWATDTVLRNEFVAVSRLDMTSGQQKLLRDLRKLAVHLTQEHIESAIVGGPYEEQSSFGLDPVAVRTHAHEPKAPTKSSPPGKPGLIWLAFESIPLHPVVPIAPNRTQTTGWRIRPDAAYVWPIWDGMLTLEEVMLLRAFPVEFLSERPGVTEVWSSRYGSTGKYGMLLPALRER